MSEIKKCPGCGAQVDAEQDAATVPTYTPFGCGSAVTDDGLWNFTRECFLRQRDDLAAENKRLLEIVEKLHPRVIKLAMRDKPFIVIGCHEPYFADAYAMIRGQEQVQGTWTDEDERLMQETIKCG